MAEAELTPLLKSVSGELGNFVFRRTKNGVVLSARPVRTATAATAQQAIVRGIFSVVSKAWQTASEAQRAAWEAYARAFFAQDRDGSGAGPSGQAVFVKANSYRQAAGLAVQLAAPTVPPPAAPTAVTVDGAGSEAELVITVEHGLAGAPAGYRLFVEATAPLRSPARRPQPGDFRAAAGFGVDSLKPLLATGQAYTITPLRSPLNDGARFGLRVSIISPDGIPSAPLAAVALQVLR